MYNQQIVHVKCEPMTEQMVNMVGNVCLAMSYQRPLRGNFCLLISRCYSLARNMAFLVNEALTWLLSFRTSCGQLSDIELCPATVKLGPNASTS